VSKSKRKDRRTQAEIQNKPALRWAYVGAPKVEEQLQEVTFMPSKLETIDAAMVHFVNNAVNLSVTTNEGFQKVPVIWSSAERSFQIKHQGQRDLRDKTGALTLPLVTVARASVVKDPTRKGIPYANIYPINDAKGGTITVARRINQKKTAEFQNALANRTYAGGPDEPGRVKSKYYSVNKRQMSTRKTVFETITIPLPTWVTVNYEIALRSEYQQQANEMMQPFFTIPGNSRMPRRIHSDGHYYEIFIDGNFANNSNSQQMEMDRRQFETIINIEVLGYLIGEGENQEKPKLVRRENAVEVKFPREHIIVGDIPENIKDGFYRE
jgi:hypothetical protein